MFFGMNMPVAPSSRGVRVRAHAVAVTGHRVTRGAGRARSAEKNTRGQGSGTRTQPEPQAEPSESTQIRDRAFVGGFIYRPGFFL